MTASISTRGADVALLSNQRGERIPLFGATGLASQLEVQDYVRQRKFRQRLRSWLELVKLYWPECTAKGSASS